MSTPHSLPLHPTVGAAMSGRSRSVVSGQDTGGGEGGGGEGSGEGGGGEGCGEGGGGEGCGEGGGGVGEGAIESIATFTMPHRALFSDRPSKKPRSAAATTLTPKHRSETEWGRATAGLSSCWIRTNLRG